MTRRDLQQGPKERKGRRFAEGILHPVQARRLALGISQNELARRAGVSRSEVSAVERRALVPSVETALRIARALDSNVEELFEGSVEDGRRSESDASSSELEARLGWDTGRRNRRYLEWEPTLAGTLPHDVVSRAPNGLERIPGSLRGSTLVLAGCDPAAALLHHFMAKLGIRLLPLLRNSATALECLGSGIADVAGVHLESSDYRPDAADGKEIRSAAQRTNKQTRRTEKTRGSGYRARGAGNLGGERENVGAVRRVLGKGFALVRLATWREGIALRPEGRRSLRTLSPERLRRVRWIVREPGSGARACLEELAADAGVKLRPRRLSSDHRMTAALVRAGWGDAGACCELAAVEAGLDFVSVRREAYDLCFKLEELERPEMQALLRVLRSKEYRRILGDLPGYDCSETGEMVGTS